MTCSLCAQVAAFLLNGLNLIDHTLNWLSLGDADETVSARVARARAAGVKWAAVFCKGLTIGQRIVTLGMMTRDHCDYALDKSVKPNTAEILDLSVWPPRLHSKPVTEE